MTQAAEPTTVGAKLVPLSQLKVAEWNPRLIRDQRFKELLRSIAQDPGFLWNRPILAMADGTVYAGNHRDHAVTHLWKNGAPPPRVDEDGNPTEPQINWRQAAEAVGIMPDTVPAILEDVPLTVAKARAIRDNNAWAEWIDTDLSEVLFELSEADVDLTSLGFDEKALTPLLDLSGIGPDTTTPFGSFEPNAMPGFVSFRFGNVSGQVRQATYDAFAERYRAAQAHGTLALDDVLSQWLAGLTASSDDEEDEDGSDSSSAAA